MRYGTLPVRPSAAIRSADGTMLHAEVFGPEDGTTLVLAHGWTEMLDFWTYAIRPPGKGFRAVAYDLRGHGASDPAAEHDYAIERFGQDPRGGAKGDVPARRRAARRRPFARRDVDRGMGRRSRRCTAGVRATRN